MNTQTKSVQERVRTTKALIERQKMQLQSPLLKSIVNTTVDHSAWNNWTKAWSNSFTRKND